jgi:hypothetical protein
MAYDSKRAVTVLFGGWDNSPMRNDTWELESLSWVQKAESPPELLPRQGHAMAYAETTGRTMDEGPSGAAGS